ncbi:DUF262 domain-containing protein [Candidatus Puniceispirillum marinum]|uniref:DUF262 domain-containing protein n=1 Tax=Puniceispirillum marinum (strain IMCC1322) TaxID=488538 RepID=D5BRV9_PUNMI|nr:DUF262 domain-containing protein [Candidatus Puniceispirillum marinum]ADE39006.1 hypothetical protein SAR116_0763 [Candidatus Puniceispirillum marinum IMCC1322]
MSGNFQVQVKNIEHVFGSKNQSSQSSENPFPVYHVPHYQRGFSWKKDEIVEFLEDVRDASKSQPDGYFIGPITILLNENTDRCEIIDGQQRLTTIALIINHLSACMLKSGDPKTQNETRRYLIARDCKAVIHHLRKDDRETFESVLELSETKPQLSIKEANEIICRHFENYNESEKSKFLSYLCNKVICIAVECLDDDISYQIFETLNARGRGLSPLDLIRNKLFSTIQDEKTLNLLLDEWDRLYVVLKRVLNGGQTDSHIQTLFSIVLSIKAGKWLEPKSLFPELRQYLRNETDASKVSTDLINLVCSDLANTTYIRWIRPTQSSNRPSLQDCLLDFNQYKILGTFAYSLLTRDFGDEVTVGAIKMAGALIKRTQVLGNIPGMQYGQLFTEMGKEIYQKEVLEDDVLEYVHEKLKDHDASSKGKLVLDDEQFVRRLSDLPVIKEERARDILIAIYNAKRDVQTLRVSSSSDLHVEHILPQELHKKNWPNFDTDTHRTYHQRLGNMMILSGKKNKQAARRKFIEKQKKYYSAEAGNEFSKVAFIDEFDDWNEETIKERQHTIANEIVNVWASKIT